MLSDDDGRMASALSTEKNVGILWADIRYKPLPKEIQHASEGAIQYRMDVHVYTILYRSCNMKCGKKSVRLDINSSTVVPLVSLSSTRVNGKLMRIKSILF